MTQSVLSLVPKTCENPVLNPSLPLFSSGLSLAVASPRQRSLIALSFALTVAFCLCSHCPSHVV